MALARPPDAVALSRSALWPLDAGCYTPHPLHAGERAWPEANCYVDLWIEVLHVLGLDPMACLPFTLATDFEGDQWTFFKPPAGRPAGPLRHRRAGAEHLASLPEHVLEQVSRGRLAHRGGRLLLPARHRGPQLPPGAHQDGHRHPGDRPRARRASATSTTGAISPWKGEDYRGQFRLGVESPGLPPYVEFAKLGALRRAPVAERVSDSVGLLRGPSRAPARRQPGARLCRASPRATRPASPRGPWPSSTATRSPRSVRWAPATSWPRTTCAGWTATAGRGSPRPPSWTRSRRGPRP